MTRLAEKGSIWAYHILLHGELRRVGRFVRNPTFGTSSHRSERHQQRPAQQRSLLGKGCHHLLQTPWQRTDPNDALVEAAEAMKQPLPIPVRQALQALVWTCEHQQQRLRLSLSGLPTVLAEPRMELRWSASLWCNQGWP